MASTKKRNSSTEVSKTCLRGNLQAAVQSIKWTYGSFWKQSSQKGFGVGDGFYNGTIKTRKTVQAAELSKEELGMHRTRQLRDLYETLASAGDSNQSSNRRPSAALTPEDLTETEWFYLLCMSCSFSSENGLPGQALLKGDHVWLTEANNASTDVFTRALLAKTVVCIPIGEEVLEFGTIDLVHEDLAILQRIKSFFSEQFRSLQSEISSSGHQDLGLMDKRLHEKAWIDPFGVSESWLPDSAWQNQSHEDRVTTHNCGHGVLDGAVSMSLDDEKELQLVDSTKSWELTHQDNVSALDGLDVPGNSLSKTDVSLHNFKPSPGVLHSVGPFGPHQPGRHPKTVHSLSEQDGHNQYKSAGRAFLPWRLTSALVVEGKLGNNSQWMLKKALFHVTHLYSESKDDRLSWNKEADNSFDKLNQRKSVGGQEELNVSHVLAERRRREKLNDRFMLLRALVPFVTKMDKASILGDTVEYVKQLQNRVQELELCIKQMELLSSRQDKLKKLHMPHVLRTSATKALDASQTENRNGSQMPGFGPMELSDYESVLVPVVPTCDSETRSQVEGKSNSSVVSDREQADFCNSDGGESDTSQSRRSEVIVNLKERDVSIELCCPWKMDAFITILDTLNNLQLDVFEVKASTEDGTLSTYFAAKLKETHDAANVSKVKIQTALQLIAAAANSTK